MSFEAPGPSDVQATSAYSVLIKNMSMNLLKINKSGECINMLTFDESKAFDLETNDMQQSTISN